MIHVYGASWCTPCRNAKKFLDRNGIGYTYYDVEINPEAMAHINSLGYSGVPVFQTEDGEHWQGFDLPKLKELVA